MKKPKWEKFASEYVVSLFPVFMLVHSLSRGIKAIIGKNCSIAVKIQNHAADYLYLPEEWKTAHLALVTKIKAHPAFLEHLYRQMEVLGKKQVRRIKKHGHLAVKLSNADLYKYYNDFIQSNTKIYDYGLLLPLLDYQETTFLSDEVNKILKSREADKYFITLTTPLRYTHNKQQDLSLLELYTQIEKYPQLLPKIKNLDSSQVTAYFKNNHPKIYRLLMSHTEKFNWVYYVYEGPAVTAEYFVDAIRDFIRRRINPSKELIKEQEGRRRLALEQDQIFKRLKLDPHERQIVTLARDAVFYKPYRRELQSWAYCLIEPLLAEIAKRINVSLGQLRMMLPHEVEKALQIGWVNTDDLNNRLRLMIYGAPTLTSCLTGEKAAAFIRTHVKAEKRVVLTKEFTGTIAFKGRVKGNVRIINAPEDMSKMKEKDILVAATTNPNLMPAIRVAGALVTNEGGLTCHAAIVSRELKIPCIVGTNIATKVLKDGDLVEVDADKGIVKIIKRA